MTEKPSNLVKKAMFAEIAGVSRKSITVACGKSLKEALNGTLLDLNHPDAQKYIAKQKTKKTKGVISAHEVSKKKPNTRPKKIKKETYKVDPIMALPSFHDLDPKFIEKMLSRTLSEIILLYGNEERFKTWLAAYKLVLETRAKELDLDQKQAQLVSRDKVEKYVFGYWDGLQERLLNDAPKSVSARLQGVFNSGGKLEQAEEVVREVVSKHIKGAKIKAQRSLENA